MITFINMDFDGIQWWVDYNDGLDQRNYYDTKAEAVTFYNSII